MTSRDPADSKLLTKAIADELVRRAAERAPGRPASLTDAELWVDPEVWARLLKRAMALNSTTRPSRREHPGRCG